MIRYLKIPIVAFFVFFLLLSFRVCFAGNLDQQLVEVATPYTKYFNDRALDQASGFAGLTRSFQLYLGNQDPADEVLINSGASSYEQSILERIGVSAGTRTILDTYVSYATPQELSDPNNPLINCNGNYYGAGGTSDKIQYGLYWFVRILNRDAPSWWDTWDWMVDTGANACFIVDALEAYQKTSNVAYKNFAILLGGYLLKLQDSDGGIRYGPRGMYHPDGPDFFWNLKSTEKVERCMYAFDALYTVTGDTRYSQASTGIKGWLKSMYNTSRHLYYSAATFNGTAWVKSDIDGYVATDVMAFAPVEMMFSDTFFGATQAARDAEVDAMFSAIEAKTGFLDANNNPLLFRFSVSQTPDPLKGDYGTLEWSAQMALAYLRAAQVYAPRDWNKTQAYINKYYTLIASLETYFSVPAGDSNAKVAPYASYFNDKSVAAGVPTGTGYTTDNCQAALASAYYVFAKAGYDQTKLGGGTGIPDGIYNSIGMQWYQNTSPYNSTAAAVCQMILNFLRDGTGKPPLTQQAIYEYAKSPSPYGPELYPDEVAKALGHFDPYDALISNWSNSYDSLPGGNPYKGYNYDVDTYDPRLDSNAINKYMRDICHWMAYTVTQEDWWKNGALVAHPNTPAAIPIYGTYNHWVVVKGFSASTNPCPEPHTNPWNSPDFTVYGFWIKNPLVSGIGQDTYKTAAECASTYFLPLSSSDSYNGKFVQVAEPPMQMSQAKVEILRPADDAANLAFIGVKKNLSVSGASTQLKAMALSANATSAKGTIVIKKDWRDILPVQLLTDTECVGAFGGTRKGTPVLVKRNDIQNAAYYLLPFDKRDKKGIYLTSAVILLDANNGCFKEVSWAKAPEKFLGVDYNGALGLVRNYIIKDLNSQLVKLRRMSFKEYQKRSTILYKDYSRLLGYLNGAKRELLWSSNSLYSKSPYQPYWGIDANGYIWYVTQEGKVFSGIGLDKMIAEIDVNRAIVEKR